MKLNQAIAIEKGTKTKTYDELSEVNNQIQKAAPFQGLSREYKPKDENGDTLPSESSLVQLKVMDVVNSILPKLETFWDITATKETGNTEAFADVKLDDGQVIIPHVPVTYLLFLEKQFTDIRKFILNMPVLDPAHEWTQDQNSEQYRAKEVTTHRTKKNQKAIVLYDATDKHPAQTQLITEDEIVGYWSTTQLSGAIPAVTKREMVERVDQLLKAVKVAREEANSIEVQKIEIASGVLDYIFKG